MVVLTVSASACLPGVFSQNNPDAAEETPDAGHPDAGMSDAGGADAGLPFDAGNDAGSVARYVYVATGSSVSTFELELDGGTLAPLGAVSTGGGSTFAAVNPAHTQLYVVGSGSTGLVKAYAINPADGGLTFLNEVSTEGTGPSHVVVDRSGKWVLAANNGSGSVAVLPVHADGMLGAATDSEDTGVNAHQIVVDPANKFVFVPTLGGDCVLQYVFDADAGLLTANTPAKIDTVTDAGPRHMDFHPNGKFAYLINERNNTMTAYAFDAVVGTLSEVQTVNTLPSGFADTSYCADVHVHPNGKFLYGSNRGHNSIVVFALNPSTGEMTLVEHVPTGGDWPRNFTIDPSGTLLFVANQYSGDIHAFAINQSDGKLTPLGEATMVSGPAFVGIVTQPR